jgi:hypothetical protein
MQPSQTYPQRPYLPKNIDLAKVKCAWLGSPFVRGATWRNVCHFKAKYLVGGVPICSVHFRMMRRAVEGQRLG